MNRTALRLAALLMSSAFANGYAHDEHLAARPGEERLGRVHFNTSCTREAQRKFERALAMLHSFFFPETLKAFDQVIEADPTCAIAYWGLAVSARPNPLVGPFDAATLKRGLDAVRKGEAIGAKTGRERDWLAAIKAFYADYETVDQDTRTRNYEKAMERLAKKYPNDVEAKIFHALALNEIFDHRSHAPLVQAIAILEPIGRRFSDHPGVTHYLIHSYDFAPLAKHGVAAANKYAKLAPAAPHAQHMPSHIYSMLGMWDASIASNLRSVAVAKDYAAKNGLDGTLAGVPHSYDFMAYAYLQLGQDAKARALIDEAAGIGKVIGPRVGGATGRAAVPARYVLERQDWQGAARLAPLGTGVEAAEAVTHFARALGAARSGDAAAAQADVDRLKELRADLQKTNQGYWAGQVEIQILAAQAWLAHAQGNKADAIRSMCDAADLEDASAKHVAMENRLYPMRELFADLLLQYGRPSWALREYEASMLNAPNRLRGYYGAARAAEASGERAKAAGYFAKLAQLTRAADGDRAEIRESRQRLAAR
ncbi:MAG TPA: hypothetical protein VHP37_17040 [Burkholderiales bacterium]|nr:hypothetical protein [Burkholderiales bacterium]